MNRARLCLWAAAALAAYALGAPAAAVALPMQPAGSSVPTGATGTSPPGVSAAPTQQTPSAPPASGSGPASPTTTLPVSATVSLEPGVSWSGLKPGRMMAISGIGASGTAYRGRGAPTTLPDADGDVGEDAAEALLSEPEGLAFGPGGDLFVADAGDHLVEEIDAATGNVSIYAGDGVAGYSGDGGPAAAAELDSPTGIALDSAGDLFVADPSGDVVREVSAATGIVTTVAGDGTAGYSGDGGPATSAELDQPTGVAVDPAGDVFFTDSANEVVREVNAQTGIVTTVAGDGTAGYSGDGGPARLARLDEPGGLTWTAPGVLLVADSLNNRIRMIDLATGTITTIAGDGRLGATGDCGPAVRASLAEPTDVAVAASGLVYIADHLDHRIRVIDPATGEIATLAGDGSAGTLWGMPWSLPGGGDGAVQPGSAGSPPIPVTAHTMIGTPLGIAVSGGGIVAYSDEASGQVVGVDPSRTAGSPPTGCDGGEVRRAHG